jgi:hypothetical protein
MSLFELALGTEVKQPLDLIIPHTMGYCKDSGKNGEIMAKERKELNVYAKKLLEEAQARYEKQANKSRKEIQFEIGDLVMLNIQDFKMLETLVVHFVPKYVGPYKIMHKPH